MSNQTKHDEIVDTGFGISVIISFLAMMGYWTWFLMLTQSSILLGILGFAAAIPITLFGSYIVGAAIGGPVGYALYVVYKILYGIYWVASWLNNKRLQNNRGALVARKEALRKQIVEVVEDGPTNHRYARVDPSYLDDAERLKSLAEQEDDSDIRGMMQEYCQLSKKLQTS